MSEYSEIRIDCDTGKITVREKLPDEDGRVSWLDQYFTGYNGENGQRHYGTVCLTERLEERKKWLVGKIIGDAKKELDEAEKKLNNLKKLLL